MTLSTAARRWIGSGLVALSAVAAVCLVVGWLASLQGGTVLERDTDLELAGGRAYVVPTTSIDSTCSLTGPGDVERALTFADDPPAGGGLSGNQRRFAPGGVLVDPVDGPAVLRCEYDARVLTGTTALLPLPAEAGLWLVVPAAVLFATGSALLRRPEDARPGGSSAPTGPVGPPRP